MAFDQNMQTAFLHYMYDSSVIEYGGKLVKGYPVISKQSPDTTGKLLWRPAFAAIASSGDFGYTTGPYTYNIKGKNVAFGNYATVWEKQGNGEWKLVIDLGAGHRAAIKKDTITSIAPDPGAKNAEQADLIAIDKSFAARLAGGSQEVYREVLHPAAHILRDGKDAVVSEQQKQALFSEATRITFKPEQFKIASSKDMGVVYGSCETDAIKDGKHFLQQGVYMHVWRKDGLKGWQILHETIHTTKP
jgi:ketosteroid isomerase-like protein